MRLNTPHGNEEDRFSKRFVSVHDFRRIGSQLLSKNQFAYDISDNDMVYEFGATPLVLTILWKLLVVKTHLPENLDPLHLLWWLHFAKHYHTKKKFRQATKWSHQTTKKWMTPIAKRMVPLCPFVVGILLLSSLYTSLNIITSIIITFLLLFLL
jgi:hypothetical protein